MFFISLVKRPSGLSGVVFPTVWGMIAGRYRFGYICFHPLWSCTLILFLGFVYYPYGGVLEEFSCVVHLFAIIGESCPFLKIYWGLFTYCCILFIFPFSSYFLVAEIAKIFLSLCSPGYFPQSVLLCVFLFLLLPESRYVICCKRIWLEASFWLEEWQEVLQMMKSVFVGFLKIVTVKLLLLLLNVTSRKFRELSVSPCLLNIKVRFMLLNLCMTLGMSVSVLS
jgi:hypothetical protein